MSDCGWKSDVHKISRFAGFTRLSPSRHQRPVCQGGGAEADEPGVVVERTQGFDNQTDPRQSTADQGCDDGGPVPTAIVCVSAFWSIQIAKLETLLANEPVVGDQHSRDGAEAAGVADEPRE